VLIRLLSSLAILILRFLRFTWRVRIIADTPLDTETPLVFCFWHGRQAGLFAFPHFRPVAVMSSLSRDGEIQARILSALGFRVVRGSSSRGGAIALRGVIAALRAGLDAAVAVDGPRGPRHQVKPGAVMAARVTGARLVPVDVHARPRIRFRNAWDRYELPLPFSRVRIVVGAPLASDEMTTERLQAELRQLVPQWKS
jgi:lysophospholipid acyltransferase (LPLAT)-like uncharacterized protein